MLREDFFDDTKAIASGGAEAGVLKERGWPAHGAARGDETHAWTPTIPRGSRPGRCRLTPHDQRPPLRRPAHRLAGRRRVQGVPAHPQGRRLRRGPDRPRPGLRLPRLHLPPGRPRPRMGACTSGPCAPSASWAERRHRAFGVAWASRRWEWEGPWLIPVPRGWSRAARRPRSHGGRGSPWPSSRSTGPARAPASSPTP